MMDAWQIWKLNVGDVQNKGQIKMVWLYKCQKDIFSSKFTHGVKDREKNALYLIHGSNTSDHFSCFSSLDVIFTARQRSCGKVMFSQVFVHQKGCHTPLEADHRPPPPRKEHGTRQEVTLYPLEGTWDKMGSDIITAPGTDI